MPKPRILIVAASLIEVKNLLKGNITKKSEYIYTLHDFNFEVNLLITGVGATSMTYFLTKELQREVYNFSILIGIAGSYSKSLKIGDIVNVQSERFADLGILNKNSFIDLFDMNIANSDLFPFENKLLKNFTLINNEAILQLKNVKGNTVQTIRPKILTHIQEDTDIESMEGASFAFVCAQEKMPYAHIRTISNYVGEQDKANWNIALAVNNLALAIIKILKIL